MIPGLTTGCGADARSHPPPLFLASYHSYAVDGNVIVGSGVSSNTVYTQSRLYNVVHLSASVEARVSQSAATDDHPVAPGPPSLHVPRVPPRLSPIRRETRWQRPMVHAIARGYKYSSLLTQVSSSDASWTNGNRRGRAVAPQSKSRTLFAFDLSFFLAFFLLPLFPRFVLARR